MSDKKTMFIVLFVVFPVAMMANLPAVKREACSCHDGVQQKVTKLLEVAREIELICGTCPVGWVRHGDSCYYVHGTLRQKQADARRTCQNMGADLPIITSTAENDFVSNLIPKNVPYHTGVWIGLQRKLSDSKFYWIDGTPLQKYDSKWRPGQPDNHRGAENCVHLFGSASGDDKGTWNDIYCHYNSIAVCEKPL